jgi:AraC-like DNA-binding protein
MRPEQTKISSAFHSPIAVVEKNEPFFNLPFHYHNELELVYIKEGRGKKIIGDKLETFEAGEIIFLGSNLPHVWYNDDEFYNEASYLCACSIVAYFDKEVFSKDFYGLKESNKINFLLQQAGRGIKVVGETRLIVAQKMEELVCKKDFGRILGLMEIFHILSLSGDLEFIEHEGYEVTVPQNRPDRITEVFNFVSANYKDDISLEDIAQLVHLTPPAFCRLFKQKTGRSFIDFLNEVRISNACKYLIETGYNISEIAFLCGYRTLSNFNKIFKKSTGLAPKAYREAATPRQRLTPIVQPVFQAAYNIN